MEISRRCVVDYVKKLRQKVCGTCSTIIIKALICRCRSRRHFVKAWLN